MARAKYTYSIQNDFPNHTVAVDRLTLEISSSVISIALDCIDTEGDVCDIWFKGTLLSGDVTILGGILAAHSGTPLPSAAQPVTLDGITTIAGKLVTIPMPTQGVRKTVFTFNWCDKTTWYADAARVVSESPTDSGDHLTYTLAHTYVIDTYHGKLSQEDFLADSDDNSYRVLVVVDSVVKTEQDPHYGTGGDFTVDYVAGEVTFLSEQSPSSVIHVTYHYARTAKFTLIPDDGKDLDIVRVEVQFSKDVVLRDTVRFQATGLVGPGGSRVPVVEPTVYKTMYDFLNDCDGNSPTLPAFSTSSWRGLAQDMVTLPWNYAATIRLLNLYKMQVDVTMDHDTAFDGTSATATFYCLTYDADT